MPPPNKVSFPKIEDDKSWSFRCHAPNWRPIHKCKEKQVYICEIESDSDNDIELENSNEESKKWIK